MGTQLSTRNTVPATERLLNEAGLRADSLEADSIASIPAVLLKGASVFRMPTDTAEVFLLIAAPHRVSAVP